MGTRAWVTLPPGVVRSGQFPAVSVLSGQPSDSQIIRKLQPANEGAAMAVGGLIGLAVMRAVNRNSVIVLAFPVTAEERARERSMAITRGVMLVLCLCAFLGSIIAFAGSNGQSSGATNGVSSVGLAGFVGSLVGVLLVIVFLRSALVVRRRRGDEVSVKADPRFAAALMSAATATPYVSYGGWSTPPAAPATWATAATPATGPAQSFRPAPPVAAPVTAPALAAGWYPDPGGQFAHRWWDGAAWTHEVATADGHRAQG